VVVELYCLHHVRGKIAINFMYFTWEFGT